MTAFAIKDVGPIKQLTITAPPGHVTVLKGPNGSGKTTALAAMSSVATGKKNNDLSMRDGSKNGSISGAGVMLKLTPSGSNKRTGELNCEPVDENLTIADIVDPGVKDPDAADRKRVAAVCTMLAIEPDLDLFAECFEDTDIEIKEVVSKKTLDAESVVGMANGLKKDVFALALELEKESVSVEAEINTIQSSIANVNLSAECDAEVLDKAVDDATATKSTLEERLRTAVENQTQLDDMPVLPPVEKLKSQIADLDTKIASAKSVAEESATVIQDLKSKLEAAEKEAEANGQRIKDLAHEHETLETKITSSSVREKLQESVRLAPKPEEVEAASLSVLAAKKNRDDGVIIRKAKEQVILSEKKSEYLDDVRERASTARSLGKKFQKRLADLLDGTGLSVNDNERLVVNHPVRGECLFSELSDGERWTKSIEIAVESADRRHVKNGLLLIQQTAWEGLDETNRRVIQDAIAGTDLAIITAEAFGEQGDEILSETL